MAQESQESEPSADELWADVWHNFGVAGGELFDSITGSYELSPAELAILHEACRTSDLLYLMEHELLAGQARLMVAGAAGQLRVNPLVAQIGEQRRVLASLIQAMALPGVGEQEGQVRSPAQAAKANLRWTRRDKGRGRGGLEAI